MLQKKSQEAAEKSAVEKGVQKAGARVSATNMVADADSMGRVAPSDSRNG